MYVTETTPTPPSKDADLTPTLPSSSDSAASAEPEVYRAPPRAPGYFKKLWLKSSDLVFGIVSPDRDTRRMTFLFWISLVGLIASIATTIMVFHQRKAAEQAIEAAQLQAFDEDEEVREEPKSKIHYLGSYTVSLEAGDDVVRPAGQLAGVNLIELEVYMECDVEETCEGIKKQNDRVRDQILRNLPAIDREDVLTRDGKRRLREVFMKILNEYLKKGKVRAIYFSKVMVG